MVIFNDGNVFCGGHVGIWKAGEIHFTMTSKNEENVMKENGQHIEIAYTATIA